MQEHIKELEEDKAAYIKEAEAALETDDLNPMQGRLIKVIFKSPSSVAFFCIWL